MVSFGSVRRSFISDVMLMLAVFSLSGPLGLACQVDEVTLEMINGQAFEGTLEKIDKTGLVQGKGLPADCNLDQVAVIKIRQPKSSASPTGIQVRLAAGGLIYADRLTIGDDKVEIESAGRKETIPLEVVQAVVW